MQRLFAVIGMILMVVTNRPVAAQTTAAGEADPGVRPTRLIDRAEVRVSRVEIQAGATRRVHTHEDVVYHLWIHIQGNLQLTIGADAPTAVSVGQAFFIKRSTPHGFKNIGTTPAAVFEIFIKQTTTAGGPEALDLLTQVLAKMGQANGLRP